MMDNEMTIIFLKNELCNNIVAVLGEADRENQCYLSTGEVSREGKLQVSVGTIHKIGEKFCVELVQEASVSERKLSEIKGKIVQIVKYDVEQTRFLFDDSKGDVFVRKLEEMQLEHKEGREDIDMWSLLGTLLNIEGQLSSYEMKTDLSTPEELKCWRLFLDLKFLRPFFLSYKEKEISECFWKFQYRILSMLLENNTDIEKELTYYENNFGEWEKGKIEKETGKQKALLNILQIKSMRTKPMELKWERKRYKEKKAETVNTIWTLLKERENEAEWREVCQEIKRHCLEEEIIDAALEKWHENMEQEDEIYTIIESLTRFQDKKPQIMSSVFQKGIYHEEEGKRDGKVYLLFEARKNLFYIGRENLSVIRENADVLWKKLGKAREKLFALQDEGARKAISEEMIKLLYQSGYVEEARTLCKEYCGQKYDKSWSLPLEIQIDFLLTSSLYKKGVKDNIFIEDRKRWFLESNPDIKQLQTIICDTLGEEELFLQVLSVLLDIERRADQIENYLMVSQKELQDESISVGYYTHMETFQYLLEDEKKHLAIMNARTMNDVQEGTILCEYFGINKNNNTEGKVFLKSFTRSGESELMWSMYGDSMKGCYVTVDKQYFKKLYDEQNAFHLYKIIYMDEEGNIRFAEQGKEQETRAKKIQGLLEKIRKEIKEVRRSVEKTYEKDANIPKSVYEDIYWWIDVVLNNAVRRIRYLVKSDFFIGEHEWRLLYDDRESEQSMAEVKKGESYPITMVKVPVPMQVESITLGPLFPEANQCVPYLTYQIESMLSADKKDERGLLPERVLFSRYIGKLR